VISHLKREPFSLITDTPRVDEILSRPLGSFLLWVFIDRGSGRALEFISKIVARWRPASRRPPSAVAGTLAPLADARCSSHRLRRCSRSGEHLKQPLWHPTAERQYATGARNDFARSRVQTSPS